MHTGGHMLNYQRHYFVNFPETVASDSDYVQWGEPIGTPIDGSVLHPNYGFGFGEDGDVDEFGNPIIGGGIDDAQEPDDPYTGEDGGDQAWDGDNAYVH